MEKGKKVLRWIESIIHCNEIIVEQFEKEDGGIVSTSSTRITELGNAVVTSPLQDSIRRL